MWVGRTEQASMTSSATKCRVFACVIGISLLSGTIRADPATDPEALADSSAETLDASPFDGTVYYCTECMTEVPEHVGAGSECPHCGAYFNSATNADGTESRAAKPPTGISLRVWCGLALITIFAAEYGMRRLRRYRAERD